MTGLITQQSIQEVRQRANIEDIVGDLVQLKTAGVGAKKGLCPFHDEKSPSFTVRMHHGTYHCFGCGESGDAISFLQKMEHMTFVEAVERLAGRFNVVLTYEEGQRPKDAIDHGSRQRLLQANALAEGFYADQLRSPEAGAARKFLAEKGFAKDSAAQFGIGYAPKGWDGLQKYLRERGFHDPELVQSGLLTEGQRGAYDRFRGRVIWPIRDIMGATIGFGARKLYEDDPGPKYLNTPETPLYKKSQVLYGLDLAKRSISKNRRVVVVEGYTDVMAAHLAGVPEAVATCGTAFGEEHIRLVRRLIGDTDRAAGIQLASDSVRRGEVIFTFDGDAAGQKAALKAYNDDSKFLAQTYVAVAEDGMDPCDLRLHQGDAAVRALIDSRKPLFEFAIHSVLKQVDLDSAEGRVSALRAAAPVVAGIRDNALRNEYARRLAGWLGSDLEDVRRSVNGASKRLGSMTTASAAQSSQQGTNFNSSSHAQKQTPFSEARDINNSGVAQNGGPASNHTQNSDLDEQLRPSRPLNIRDVINPQDPIAMHEARTLGAVLQMPHLLSDPARFDALPLTTFSVPSLRAIHEAIVSIGGVAQVSQQSGLIAGFMERLYQELPEVISPIVPGLANLPVPARDELEAAQYVDGLLRRLEELSLTREIAEIRSHMQRHRDVPEATTQQLMSQLVALDQRKRALKGT